VVSQHWLMASVQAGAPVDEAPYLVLGDSQVCRVLACPPPPVSCLYWLYSPLLHGKGQ